MATGIQTLLGTDPKSWPKESIVAGLGIRLPRHGKIDKQYYQFLEKLYDIKYQIPKHKLPVLYAESFKELAVTLGIRAIPTNRREVGNQLFENLYDHCMVHGIGLTHLTRATGFPTITKSWMFGQLCKTTPTNRDLKMVRDPAKSKCISLIVAKNFSHAKPIDVAILTELFHAKVTLPPVHHAFIYKHLVNEGMHEMVKELGIPKCYRKRSPASPPPSTTYRSVCMPSEPRIPPPTPPPQDPDSDRQNIIYHALYQYCVAKDLDLSDLTRTTFPKITVPWFKGKLSVASTSPHDIDRAKDPLNEKFRNLVAFKHYDHANPQDMEFLKLLYSHRTQLTQKDYKFIKAIVKRTNQPSKTSVPTENIIVAKQNVTAAISDYYAARRSIMNPSPIRTKTRNKRLTFMEKRGLAELKGDSFLGEEPIHAFQVLGFGGDHLTIVDGDVDKTVSLPKYVLKNFVEAEIGSNARKQPQMNRKNRIKRLLNPMRATVREQCLMLPTAKVLCVCLPNGAYEAVRLQRMTMDEKDAIQEELFTSYETREANMMRDLEEEELDTFNTCYV